MNNPNPFLSQGVLLDQKNKARTRLKIAVYSSISLSGVVLVGMLLIQGCNQPAEPGDKGAAGDSATNTPQLGNSVPETNTSNTLAANTVPETNFAPSAPISNPPPPVVAQPPPPVAETQEYTIVKGDILAHIATNNHVSTTAILNANPGIDPKKLKIGQKIKIPGAASPSSTSVAPMSAPMAADNSAVGGTITYKVKSGDNLTTISKHYHVSIKAIQSANNLTTAAIKVGQVLKIPGAAAPAPEAAPTAPVPAPMTTTAAPAAAH